MLIVRETGWDIATYRQQPAADIFDLIADLNESPPAWRILGLLHLERQQAPPSRSRAATTVNPETGDTELGEIMSALGSSAQPMPAELRARMQRAQSEIARLNATK